MKARMHGWQRTGWMMALSIGAWLGVACASHAPPSTAAAPVATTARAPRAVKPPETYPDFTFVVAADSHAVLEDKSGEEGVKLNEQFTRNIAFLKHIPGDFVVIAGDVTDGYADPPVLRAMWRKWGELERQLDRKLVLVPGNHDVYDESSERIWRDRNGPTYRSFDHKGSHFIILNSEDQAAPQKIDGAQLEWLTKDLERDTARHTFVFLHRPLWIEANDNWDSKVQPLLAQHKVDTVFAGHWHRYCLCPTRNGVHYVVASSIGRPNDGVGGFLSALPVTVSGRGGTSSYRVVQADGTELPSTVVQWDWLQKAERAIVVGPVTRGAAAGDARISVKIDNPFELPIEGTATLDVAGTQWKSAQMPISVKPGAPTTVELQTSLGRKLLPLPRLIVDLNAGETRLGKRTFLPNVGEFAKFKSKKLDDFDDNDLQSSAKASHIAPNNGQWDAAHDEFGSMVPVFGTERSQRDGVDTGVMHVAGHHGVSHDPKWCFALLQNWVGGKPNTSGSLAPSIGISFVARSDRPSTVWLMVEGTVHGIHTAGAGAGHRVELTASKDWTRYTYYWQQFEQPSWACPGDHCANAPLTVDKVETLVWTFRDEDNDFDLWLDDVQLLYER